MLSPAIIANWPDEWPDEKSEGYMAKKALASTVKGIEKLLRDGVKGEYGTGTTGLLLSVNGPGAGSWLYRYSLGGKRRKIGIGKFPETTLAAAIKRAAELRADVARGIDVLDMKEQQGFESRKREITFAMVAGEYLITHAFSWSNQKHATQWKNTLATYAFPVIGNLPPSQITVEHLQKILKPIWSKKRETADRTRNRIELILDFAKVKNLRDGENPARWRGNLEHLFSSKKVVRHQPALPYAQIQEFWQALMQSDDLGSKALRFAILTACRSNEVLAAKWDEIDGDIWTIPAERAKVRKKHRVPLCVQARELLESLPVVGEYIFPGRKPGTCASSGMMLMKCRRLNFKDKSGNVIVPHGFRSTFRDWAAECTSFQNIVVEQALAHSIGNGVEAAYRRSDLLEKRRELMNLWGNYVVSLQQYDPI